MENSDKLAEKQAEIIKDKRGGGNVGSVSIEVEAKPIIEPKMEEEKIVAAIDLRKCGFIRTLE